MFGTLHNLSKVQQLLVSYKCSVCFLKAYCTKMFVLCTLMKSMSAGIILFMMYEFLNDK